MKLASEDYIDLWVALAPEVTPRPVALTSRPIPLIVLQPARVTTKAAINASAVVFMILDFIPANHRTTFYGTL